MPLLGSLKAAELLLAQGEALPCPWAQLCPAGSSMLCFNAAVPLPPMLSWGAPEGGWGGMAAPWGYQGLVMDRLTCLTVNWNRVWWGARDHPSAEHSCSLPA